MKKIFNFLSTAIIAFGISACSDVPAPYDINDSGETGGDNSTYINESFASSFGSFTVKTVKGIDWVIDSHSYAKATGYDNDSKATTPSQSYIVSKAIDLSNSTGAYITFEYVLRYYTNYGSSKPGVEDKVLITDNYTGDPTTTTWTDISGKLTEGTDWNTWYTYAKNIPATFIGKNNVVVALYYACQDNSATWEVKELTMKEGIVEETPDTPDTPDIPDTPGDGVYANESFKTSFGSFNVQTATGLPWIIDFSCAKATGYDNSTKTTTPSKSYLMSAPIDLSSSEGAVIKFEYILRYFTNYGEAKPGVEDKVLITDNYTGNPTTTTWTDISGKLTEGTDWNTWSTYETEIPAAFIGKNNIVVALYYACQDNSATWEVRNISIKEGKAGDNTGTGGEVSENSITLIPSELNLANGTEMGTQTLTDGTQLIFDAGGNRNGPKYYTSGTNIRIYPNNTITVKASKNIKSVIINCDEAQGTIYNASGDVSATNGKVNTNETVISINDINNTETVITNTSTTTGAPSQIRIVKLVINYAE